MVFPQRDAELGPALLAQVPLAPLRLSAQGIKQTEEELLRRDLQGKLGIDID